LRHAFQYCLDDFQTCPVYDELMAERRLRRIAVAGSAMDELKHGECEAAQIKMSRRHQKPFAGAA